VTRRKIISSVETRKQNANQGLLQWQLNTPLFNLTAITTWWTP